MSDSLPTSDAPVTPTAMPCCPLRSAMQIPLLLVAAAGIGYAGQHVWHNRTDIQSLVGTGQAKTCAVDFALGSGCGASAEVVVAASGCSPSASHCCAATQLAVIADVETEETVSALEPANAPTGL